MDFFKKNKKVLIVASILAFAGLGLYIRKWEFRRPVLEVNFFSLNKGRSIFIRTPENKTILIGGGQNSEVIRDVTRVTPFYTRDIDYLFIPSALPAQIGGLIEIVSRYEIGEIVIPKHIATSTVLSLLLKEIGKKKIHIEEVERGDKVEIGDTEVEILFPYRDFKFNKSSLPEFALRISFKGTSAYLLGNLSKTIQKDIFKNTEINNNKNVLEFYNSMSEGRVFDELVKKISPEFIFSTKEKAMHLISNGDSWRRE